MTNFNFTNYLVSKNWNLVNGIYYKDNKSIRILKSKKEKLSRKKYLKEVFSSDKIKIEQIETYWVTVRFR